MFPNTSPPLASFSTSTTALLPAANPQPYTDIDPEPTAAQRAAAQALIDAELPPSREETHPSLPPLELPEPSPLIATEYARLEAQIPISGIDTSRYEALSTPTGTPSAPPSLGAWKQTLAQAYTSQTYLTSRLSTLQSLDAPPDNPKGKEEWLASNAHLVTILGSLEKELQDTKENIDRVVLERQAAQEAVKGEIAALQKSWREGVGRVLEVEVAAEGLRGQILEERRRGGMGGGV